MTITNFENIVLLDEVINFLNIISDGIYIDATFGQGGHSKIILSYLNRNGRLLVIDCDFLSIKIAKALEKQDRRLTVIHGRFSKLFKYMRDYNLIGKVNGILLDLGISRLQLEDINRGFSFVRNGLLDMRMDTDLNLSASKWLRTASLEKIIWVLKTFGEERFSRRIANAIVEYRKCGSLVYTQELVKLIMRVVPYRDKYKHPATRTFQAIRIYINNELKEIIDVLKASLQVLAPAGRLLVISFHSLEDRIVKGFIRQHSTSLRSSNGLDFINIKNGYNYHCSFIHCSNRQYRCYLRFIDRIFPSEEEIKNNIRVRSAVLRCAEKIIE